MVVVHLLLSFPSLTVSPLHLSGTDIPLDKILFLIFLISFVRKITSLPLLFMFFGDTFKSVCMSILGIVLRRKCSGLDTNRHTLQLPSSE